MRRAVIAGMAAAALAGCAHAPLHSVVAAPGAPKAIGPYSQAVRAGDTLYLSGQIGIDPATGLLVAGGVEAETRRALENCRAVLAAAGLGPGDVVQAQLLLADIADYTRVNEIYAAFFPSAPPARAAFQVAALPKGARVEIVMTAVRSR